MREIYCFVRAFCLAASRTLNLGTRSFLANTLQGCSLAVIDEMSWFVLFWMMPKNNFTLLIEHTRFCIMVRTGASSHLISLKARVKVHDLFNYHSKVT